MSDKDDQTRSENTPQSSHDNTTQNNDAHDAWTQGKEVPKSKAEEKGPNWQRDVISKLAFSAIDEQRRTRRWGIVFKSLTFIYLFAILIMIQDDWGDSNATKTNGSKGGKHAALVEIRGVIADSSDANAATVISGLKDAFKDKNTAGIILEINSPGGSPVQSGYINDEIIRLREKYPDIPLYAVITDMCASGGYYIAAAADEIYADKASIVGSIGVLMDGFGFVDAMKKVGVERRLITAGEHKGFLDPFSKAQEEDVMHIKGLLANIHKQFIDTVKQGRGSRLKETPDLFSGLVWTGEQSVELGLIDGLGNAGYVARDILGVDSIVDFTQRPNFANRLADRLGLVMANVLSTNLGLGAPQLK